MSTGEVTALATKIKTAQAPEIEQMTGWLKNWNEPTQMAAGIPGARTASGGRFLAQSRDPG